MREEIYEQEVNLDTFAEFFFVQGHPRDANLKTKRQRKFELFNPSQAKPSPEEWLEEQLEEQHRQSAGVQPYPVIT